MTHKRLLVAVVLLAAVVAGCSKPNPSPHTASDSTVPNKPSLTDKQKFDLLKKEAHARHLQWDIFCTRFKKSDPDGFQGTAWENGVEDSNRTDRWMERGLTQADAAYALYISIQGAPTHPAYTPKQIEADELFICPLPRLRGN